VQAVEDHSAGFVPVDLRSRGPVLNSVSAGFRVG
jgi:hypothetical protein